MASMFIGEIYLVTDLLATDLTRILKATDIQLSDQQIKYITYQLIKALLYIHTANLIHRDLKPSNILVNESCDIKIWYGPFSHLFCSDFGLSRQLSMDSNEVLTEYVVTRHYRAPEIMLSSHHVRNHPLNHRIV